MSTFQENGDIVIKINGRVITERCSRRLPKDLLQALDNLYPLDQQVQTHLDADEQIDFGPQFFDIPGFPFNHYGIQNRIQAHLDRIQVRINEAASKADAIARAAEAAQTRLISLVQEKMPNYKIQHIVFVDNCLFVNGTPFDNLLP